MDEDYAPIEGCQCTWPNAMPPCGWCTREIEDSYDFNEECEPPAPVPNPMEEIAEWGSW